MSEGLDMSRTIVYMYDVETTLSQYNWGVEILRIV